MHPKTWLNYFLIFLIFLSLPILIFNYWMDPLWTFHHSHKYNQNQVGFNERQLKSNTMYFNGLEKYNGLLLGSSRTTYINQEDFKEMEIFNLASADMTPYEYKYWINIAKKIKKKDFNYIIIGIDFWGSNKNILKEKVNHNKTPQSYLRQSQELFYRYTSLASFNTFKKSKTNLKHNRKPSTIDYTRNNIKNTIIVSADRKKYVSGLQYSNYKNTIYGKNYKYDENLKKLFLELKKENKQTKFIIFTTPISKKLFRLLIEQGKYPEYKKWLADVVNIFGEVYNFMGINNITSNPNNYPDLHHFYPSVGKEIATFIITNNKEQTNNYFGTILNKNNLDDYFYKQDLLYNYY